MSGNKKNDFSINELTKKWDIGSYSKITDAKLNLLASILIMKIGNEFNMEFSIDDRDVLHIQVDQTYVINKKDTFEIMELGKTNNITIKKCVIEHFK